MADYKILTIPFARDATPDLINQIPDDPSTTAPQLASWKRGFPHVTMTPLVAGGIPPQGQDFNGILREVTEHIVHQNKGGMYQFSEDVVAAGGYPKGAVLLADNGLSLWVSLQDGNTQNFNGETKNQWSRIAFEGLDALLDSKVSLTGNETITGTKTFSSFPVTPPAVPTDDYQAANKKYVDDSALGVGQKWQDVMSQRAGGVTYTNTTGRTIFISVTVAGYHETSLTILYVNGISVASHKNQSATTLGTGTSDQATTLCAIVPNGDEYLINLGTGHRIQSWRELR